MELKTRLRVSEIMGHWVTIKAIAHSLAKEKVGSIHVSIQSRTKAYSGSNGGAARQETDREKQEGLRNTEVTWCDPFGNLEA